MASMVTAKAVNGYNDECCNTEWLQWQLPMALNGFNGDCLRQHITTACIMNSYNLNDYYGDCLWQKMTTVVTIIKTMALNTMVTTYGSEWQQC